ncbi:unnamed protein product [Sympodiomycopsis kandeliae]
MAPASDAVADKATSVSQNAKDSDAPTTSITQDQDNAQKDQQLDEDLLPFEVSLYFPDRPLVPANASQLGLPSVVSPLKLIVNPGETLNEIRVTLGDSPEGYWLGSYCFRKPSSSASSSSSQQQLGEKVGEWIDLKEVFADVPKEERQLHIAPAQYSEAEARQHIQRLRDLLSGGIQDPTGAAIDAGLSVHDSIRNPDLWTKEAIGFAAAQAAANNKAKGSKLPAADLAAEAAKPLFSAAEELPDWTNQVPFTQVVPSQARPLRAFPTCLRNLSVSAWSPPPQHLRSRGHLLYLQIGLLEGETIFVTSSTRGFFINKSSSSKFDPSPRPSGQEFASNSLFDLLCGSSPQFLANFAKIFNDPLSGRDLFAVLPLTNCMPAAPWLARSLNHTADPLRPQTAYLLTGTTSLDSLEGTRDWNEEIQSARELPRSNLPERHVRERALARLFSEFSKSAASAVPKVAAGEVQALNPMDKPDAQMYCINNLFISRGVDGVDIYPYLGGDEAAHVAVSKDVQGIRLLNSLDVEGLCLLGTVIVDWHGERWVAQSIIPGLFRKKDEDDIEEITGVKPQQPEKETKSVEKESSDASADSTSPAAAASTQSPTTTPSPAEDTQVVYGGVEGPEVIRTNAAFHKIFEKVAKSLHLAKHSVTDAKSESHELWLSVDSKGLRGADGRKYALDVARLTPVDVEFLENDLKGQVLEGQGESSYPHEMVLLRPELLEIYWDSEFRKWAREQLAQRQKVKDSELQKKEGQDSTAAIEGEGKSTEGEAEAAAEPPLDSSAFQLHFNPDAFVKFKPPTDEGGVETPMVKDESDPTVAAVRAASKYLRESAIPRLVSDVAANNASAADGQALSRQLHIRGINMRYLGLVAHLASPSQKDKLDQEVLTKAGPGYEILLEVFREVAIQEMILRASKRVLNSLLKGTATHEVPALISHFLNCLLGAAREASPIAEWTPSPFDEDEVPAWTKLTPETLQERIRKEVSARFRFSLSDDFLVKDVRKPQLLRELALRCGIQLKLQEYNFEAGIHSNGAAAHAAAASGSEAENDKGANTKTAVKKQKKSTGAKKAAKELEKRPQNTTFVSDDVLNLVPVVKDSAPTSKVAEDAFETGRITMMSRGDRELGLELLMEGINFHETIYGMIHPETARCYALFAAIAHQFATVIQHETNEKVREEQEKLGPDATQEALSSVSVELPGYAEHLSSKNAVRYQRQAATVSERTLGIDNPETLQQWASLAILERADGNLEMALRCQNRVMELQSIIFGRVHPETVTSLSNLGTALQSQRNFESSLKAFTLAHSTSLELFGADSLTTGNVAFELCQAQSLVGDLRKALETLKESVRVFELRLGKDHPNTKEAEIFLSRLASAAVRAAKLEQSAKIREARSIGAGTASSGLLSRASAAAAAAAGNTATSNASPSTPASKTKSKKGNAANVDPSLSVDELVNYISGSNNSTPSRSAKKATKGKSRF